MAKSQSYSDTIEAVMKNVNILNISLARSADLLDRRIAQLKRRISR